MDERVASLQRIPRCVALPPLLELIGFRGVSESLFSQEVLKRLYQSYLNLFKFRKTQARELKCHFSTKLYKSSISCA